MKRGFVALGVLFSSLAVWAADLPEPLERPFRELRATFDAELAAAGSDGAARFRAFERAFEEALERYRDFGDLPTGTVHLEVAQRLRAFLDHVERA